MNLLSKMAPMLLMALGAIPFTTFAQNTTDAFEGAEGAGRYTWGGRGGKVYHVTSLADDGSEGTLRWAIRKQGCRTIVFDVCGTIELQSALKINNDSVTIAGQTAPGDGICLKNFSLGISANEIIVRFIRSRLGFDMPQEDDAVTVASKDNGRHHVILDHVSASWSIDECFSVYGVKDCTVQWCYITESLFMSGHEKGAHGYAGLWGGCPTTFHHNLVAHHTSRNPRLSGARFSGKIDEELVDIRNNVFYNWGPINSGYGGEGGCFNFVGNYYKPGPRTIRKAELETDAAKRQKTGLDEKEAQDIVWRIVAPDNEVGDYALKEKTWGKFYLSGNYFDTSVEGMTMKQKIGCVKVNENNAEGLFLDPKKPETHPAGGKESLLSAVEFSVPGRVTTQTPEMAFACVINYGGCSLHRDAADLRVAKDALNGTFTTKGSNYGQTMETKGAKKKNLTSNYGIIDRPSDVGGWPELKATDEEVAFVRNDQNQNGIPDGFEEAFFGQLVDGNGHDKSPKFTNLEMYLNYIVRPLTYAQRGKEVKAYLPPLELWKAYQLKQSQEASAQQETPAQ